MYRWRRKKCAKNKPRWSDYITLWSVIIWFQDCLRQNSQDWQQYAPKHSLQVKRLTPFQTTWENTGWFKTKGECRTIYHLLHTYFESVSQKRFGDIRNLTFAIPEKSWMYSFKESFHHSMIRWHTTFDLRNLTQDFQTQKTPAPTYSCFSNLPWASLGYNIFAFHRFLQRLKF